MDSDYSRPDLSTQRPRALVGTVRGEVGDETIVIERRFRGPSESGQGGYTCGLLARRLPGAAAVSLRLPPPLERPLSLEHGADDRLTLRDGETIVAEAQLAAVELPSPPPVELSEAQAAVPGYLGFRQHAFPMCFACGPDREEGDGLRLFPGPVQGRDVVACPWRPDPALADDDRMVRPEFVWAALDCPTAFACDFDGPIVLARLTARIDRALRAGDSYVVMAWPLGRDGRKHHAACAVHTPAGEVLAMSRALWIEPKDPSLFGAAGATRDPGGPPA
jgi:hypothetical protein